MLRINAAEGGSEMTTFNLFRRCLGSEVYCAVPEDRAVPAFIRGNIWEFAGKVEPQRGRLIAFDMAEVESSVRSSGYFLFNSAPASSRAA
jgi:hypothetical protein